MKPKGKHPSHPNLLFQYPLIKHCCLPTQQSGVWTMCLSLISPATFVIIRVQRLPSTGQPWVLPGKAAAKGMAKRLVTRFTGKRKLCKCYWRMISTGISKHLFSKMFFLWHVEFFGVFRNISISSCFKVRFLLSFALVRKLCVNSILHKAEAFFAE